MYNALRELGASEATAKTAVADLPIPQHLATRKDLQTAIAEVKLDIANLRGEVKTHLAVLKFGYGPIIIGLLIKISFFD